MGGSATESVHDYRNSIIRGIPISGKHTVLHYRKRGYRYSCCNKRFYEDFPFSGKYFRTTLRLAFYSLAILRETLSISSIARLLKISPSFIFRRMKDIDHSKPKSLPEVLSIDEFRGNCGGQKFQAILTYIKKHNLVDILPSRSVVCLIDYLKSFKDRHKVKYFVIDMNRVYRDIAKSLLPNATIVIDRFHVVRYITWALENVRKRESKKMHPSRQKYFKRSPKLLPAHRNKLSDDNLDAVDVMISFSSDLATAYYLKELFYNFMASKSKNEAIPKLKKFLLSASVSGLAEFNASLTMLDNRRTYILNSFDCPYSNGFTEGTNNEIKVIKRNAYGYRIFKNFRNRIFFYVKKGI